MTVLFVLLLVCGWEGSSTLCSDVGIQAMSLLWLSFPLDWSVWGKAAVALAGRRHTSVPLMYPWRAMISWPQSRVRVWDYRAPQHPHPKLGVSLAIFFFLNLHLPSELFFPA